MDKLSTADQEKVKKMNTDRLRAKLLQADYDEERVMTMSRDQLLATYVEHLTSGKAEAATVVSRSSMSKEELALRREELELRKAEIAAAEKRAAADLEERRKAREAEDQRFRAEADERRNAREAEELRLQAEDRRLQAELEERRIAREAEDIRHAEADKLRKQEIELQRYQLELQRDRDKREQEKQGNIASQVKWYGSALKNSLAKFPHDSAEIPAYFDNVERLFSSFEIPNAIRVKLLLPYLSEKCRTLLARLKSDEIDDYPAVRQFLLNEFKLTPSQFKE